MEHRNGIIQGFLVILQNIKFSSTSNFTISISSTTIINNTRILQVYGLQLDSEYHIYLQAFTLGGVGPAGNKASITTPESGLVSLTLFSTYFIT